MYLLQKTQKPVMIPSEAELAEKRPVRPAAWLYNIDFFQNSSIKFILSFHLDTIASVTLINFEKDPDDTAKHGTVVSDLNLSMFKWLNWFNCLTKTLSCSMDKGW